MRVLKYCFLVCMLAHAGNALADRPTAGAITAERLKLPAGPGSVRGLADEPHVDPFSAQINYQVPIELPNGFGGLTPALALTYSGQLGNGPGQFDTSGPAAHHDKCQPA